MCPSDVYKTKWTKLTCSFKLRLLYPNPSDLGSQASSGEVSSTVREHVRSPRDERFCQYFIFNFFFFQFDATRILGMKVKIISYLLYITPGWIQDIVSIKNIIENDFAFRKFTFVQYILLTTSYKNSVRVRKPQPSRSLFSNQQHIPQTALRSPNKLTYSYYLHNVQRENYVLIQ